MQYNNGSNDSFDDDDFRVSEVKLPSQSFFFHRNYYYYYISASLLILKKCRRNQICLLTFLNNSYIYICVGFVMWRNQRLSKCRLDPNVVGLLNEPSNKTIQKLQNKTASKQN